MPLSPARKKKLPGFSFVCGCRDSKSVSVSAAGTTAATATTSSSSQTHSKPEPDFSCTLSSSSSSWYDDGCGRAALPPAKEDDEAGSSTFSGLLRQLDELEHSVLSWKGERRDRGQWEKVKGSVAVVKESEDPLGDFRGSMVQMIVEEEIVAVEELAELLGRFLALNSPEHHPLILLAFTEIWQQVETWLEISKKLMPEGRIMVNCGGAHAPSNGGDGNNNPDAAAWIKNSTIKALCEAFPGNLSWKKLVDREGENYLALIGPVPDINSWAAHFPSRLSSNVKNWKPCF